MTLNFTVSPTGLREHGQAGGWEKMQFLFSGDRALRGETKPPFCLSAWPQRAQESLRGFSKATKTGLISSPHPGHMHACCTPGDPANPQLRAAPSCTSEGPWHTLPALCPLFCPSSICSFVITSWRCCPPAKPSARLNPVLFREPTSWALKIWN